jgi:DNA-binding transcriptional LysR family regulator
MFDWDDMRVIRGVARARSLSGAATGLRMGPAALRCRSSQITGFILRSGVTPRL